MALAHDPRWPRHDQVRATDGEPPTAGPGVVPLASLCQRARFHASLAPDGELTATKTRHLLRHLKTCAACATYAGNLEVITSLLRRDQATVTADPSLRDREAG